MLDDSLYFVRVVQAGSFSKAAAEVGMSKSQISRIVSRLEQKLGVKLLDRTTRHLALTDAGRGFYESCQQIQQIYFKAQEQLHEQIGSMLGVIRISAPSALGKNLLVPRIHEFLANYPEIKISVDLTDKIQPLPSQDVDINFRLSASLSDSSLKAKKIKDIHFCLCASPTYLLNNKPLVTPQDLLQHRIIGLNPTMLAKWYFSNEVSLTLNTYFSINDYQSHIDCGLNDQGVINVPFILVESLIKEGKLKPILTKYPLQKKTLWALYNANQSMPIRIRTFLDFLVSG